MMTTSTQRRMPWNIYGPLVLAVLVVLAFSPANGGQFTTWDDAYWIGQNPAVNPPSLIGLQNMWGRPFGDLYTPLVHTVWYVVARLAWKAEPIEGSPFDTHLDPAFFHLASLGAHLLAAGFVFAMLRRLVGGKETSFWPALLGAGIFALHPIMVEAVAWISGLKDVLCTAAIAAGLWMAVGWAQASERRGKWLAGSAIALAVALLSKPTGVMLPPMWGVVAWAASPLGGKRLWQMSLVVATGMVASVVGAFFAARWQVPLPAPDGVAGFPRIGVAASAIGFYIGKVIWPVGFCIDYALAPGAMLRGFQWVSCSLWLLAGAGLVVVVRRDRRMMAGAAIFVLPLLPVLGLKDFEFERYSVVTDHYAYPAMIGVAVVVARALTALPEKFRWRWVSPAIVGVGLALCASLAAATHRQSGYWRSSASLYEHGLSVAPASVIMNTNYAAILGSRGDHAAALEHARRAMETYRLDPQANYNAAKACEALGDARAALRYYEVAAPNYIENPGYHGGVGNCYVLLGRYKEAAAEYRIVAQLQPSNARAIKAAEDLEARTAIVRPASRP